MVLELSKETTERVKPTKNASKILQKVLDETRSLNINMQIESVDHFIDDHFCPYTKPSKTKFFTERFNPNSYADKIKQIRRQYYEDIAEFTSGLFLDSIEITAHLRQRANSDNSLNFILKMPEVIGYDKDGELTDLIMIPTTPLIKKKVVKLKSLYPLSKNSNLR